MRAQAEPGRRGWGVKLMEMAAAPSTYAGAALLFIACTLILAPEMPPDLKDFFMVAFACVALLPGNARTEVTP
jgi:hypothetical protein